MARSAGARCAAGFAKRAVVRLLVMAGLAVVGWMLAGVLGSAANAEEAPHDPGDGVASILSSDRQQENSEAGEPKEDAEPLTQSRHVEREAPEQQATAGEPETASEPRRTSGGLLGPVTSTVTNVVGTVTNTVNGTVTGLTGTVGGAVDGAVGTIRPILDAPGTLPDVGSVLPGITAPAPAPEAGDDVVSAPPAVDTTVPAPRAETVAPAPVKKPPAPGPVNKPAVVESAAAPSSGKQAAPVTWSAIVPAEADTHAHGGSGSGGSGGGGGVPASPVCFTSASPSVSSAHEGASGRHSAHGVLSWAPTQTQLRLIGVSRHHDADGAGREAALPATSPD